MMALYTSKLRLWTFKTSCSSVEISALGGHYIYFNLRFYILLYTLCTLDRKQSHDAKTYDMLPPYG